MTASLGDGVNRDALSSNKVSWVPRRSWNRSPGNPSSLATRSMNCFVMASGCRGDVREPPGGSIWIASQQTVVLPSRYEIVSDTLVVLLGLVCTYIEIDNLRAWRGYSNQLSEMTNNKISRPKHIAAFVDYVLCLAMALACIMYVCFNPFGDLVHATMIGPG
jgi:hypothetical protein